MGSPWGFDSPLIVSLNETLNNNDYVLTAVAHGDSSFGVLHSSSDLDVATSVTGVNLMTEVGFYDVITVVFPPFTGETGYLIVDYTLDGTLSQTGRSFASSQAQVCTTFSDCQYNDYVVEYEHEPSSRSVSGLFSFSDPFKFTYGTPFVLLFRLTTDDEAILPSTASSDFANTLTLSGLHTFGPDMQPVTGATFTSVSGTQYGPNGVISATPEPSSPVLVVSALTILLGVGFRRRIRHAERFRRDSKSPINCISPNVA